MAVIDLPSRGKPVTSKPTVATPVLVAESVRQHLSEIDEDLDHLFCATSAVCGTQDVPDEVINALRTLHMRMKRNVNAIYMLG